MMQNTGCYTHLSCNYKWCTIHSPSDGSFLYQIWHTWYLTNISRSIGYEKYAAMYGRKNER